MPACRAPPGLWAAAGRVKIKRRLLDYWIIGLLDYWITGLLDYWSIGVHDDNMIMMPFVRDSVQLRKKVSDILRLAGPIRRPVVPQSFGTG